MRRQSPFFIDTNIAICAVDSSDQRKQKTAIDLLALAHQGLGCISHQVVEERFNVMLRKASTPLTANEAHRIYGTLLEPLWKVHSSRELIRIATEIQADHSISWWDSLVVGAAIQGGCAVLYSEDLQHDAIIRGVRIENPFR